MEAYSGFLRQVRVANFLIEDPRTKRLLIKLLSIVQTCPISNLGHFVKLGFSPFGIDSVIHQVAGGQNSLRRAFWLPDSQS